MTHLGLCSPRAVYREGLLHAKLKFQCCLECYSTIFYPRVVCPSCGGVELEWRISKGLGTIYAATMVRSRSGDYNVSLIDLDEGYRMMCTVKNDLAEEPAIGMRVEVVLPKGTTPETLLFRKEG